VSFSLLSLDASLCPSLTAPPDQSEESADFGDCRSLFFESPVRVVMIPFPIFRQTLRFFLVWLQPFRWTLFSGVDHSFSISTTPRVFWHPLLQALLHVALPPSSSPNPTFFLFPVLVQVHSVKRFSIRVSLIPACFTLVLCFSFSVKTHFAFGFGAEYAFEPFILPLQFSTRLIFLPLSCSRLVIE